LPSLSLLYEMTLELKKLWLLVAEKSDSNLEARMVYDELLKQLNMSKETVVLSITEAEEGLEVRISEKAYGNFAVIGLIEQIKFNLLNVEEVPEMKVTTKTTKGKSYDA